MDREDKKKAKWPLNVTFHFSTWLNFLVQEIVGGNDNLFPITNTGDIRTDTCDDMIETCR